jgi:cytoskeletal protein RodZ
LSDNYYPKVNENRAPIFQQYRKPNQRFNPYLLGVLVGIALAIIFLLLYKFVYLNFFATNTPIVPVSSRKAELQAEIEWYTAALAEGPCQTTPKEDIPTKLDDVSDLYGCWVNESNYVNPNTGVGSYHSYCFDHAGNIENYSAMKNSQGEITSECRVRATATMKGESFTITELDACPGWHAVVVSCRLKSPGIARCTVSSPGHPDEFMDFFYRGEPMATTMSEGQ